VYTFVNLIDLEHAAKYIFEYYEYSLIFIWK
jgi:hypothetical protein